MKEKERENEVLETVRGVDTREGAREGDRE